MKTQKQATERDDEHVEEPEDKPAKPVVKEDENDGTVLVDLEPARKPRKQRREEHQDDEVGRIRAQLEDERRARAALEQQVARGFQTIEQRQQPVEDPYKKRISSIREEQESIQTMLRTGALTDPNAVERARTRFYALMEEAEDLRDQRVVEMAARRTTQAPQQQSAAAEEAIIRSEFPDVIGNPQAIRWATGEFYRLTASGEPATLATSRKAMQAAAETFKLRQPALPAVPPSQQQRYGAINGQAGARPAGAEVRLDKTQKKMALANWPQLEEHEAYARMARLVQGMDQPDDQQ